MIIGIEAQRIFRKKKHGMDIVALEMIRALQTIDQTNQYVVFVKDDEDRGVLSESENLKIAVLPRSPYPLWEQVLLPRAASRLGVDILHCTSNTAPLRVTMPLVITLHDIIYLEKLNLTRGSLYQIAGNLYRRWNVPKVVRNASSIITVSQYEREVISTFFSIGPERVHAIHNGVGKHFRPVTDPAALQKARAKYNLPPEYIFFLGNTDPKKNVEGVLRAIAQMRKTGTLPCPILMLDIDRDFLRRMADRIGDPGILDSIVFSGYVPNADLPSIYSQAKIFLYPSLRESFGIPILEAMSCGTPVITSNSSSMPEVAGGAAVLVDPFNPASIADAVVNLAADQDRRISLSKAGLENARRFSWDSCAQSMLSVYQSVGLR